MNIEYYISKRLFYTKKKNNRYTKPIIRIGTLAIILSVSVMLFSIMVTSGFKEQITNKIIGFSGDVIVTSFSDNYSYESNPINIKQDFYQNISQNEDIIHISVFATKPGIIKTKDEILGTVLKGVSSDFDWRFFIDNLVEGSVPNINDTILNNNVIISRYIANTLDLSLEDDLIIYFAQEPTRVRKFRIIGIYNTALIDFDKLFVLVDIKHIQKLNYWTKEQVGGFEINVKDFNDLDRLSKFIYDNIGFDLNSQSVKEIYPELFDWLKLQNINVILILSLMLIVGVVNMITVLLIIILEKTSLIGILKALGVTNWSIRKIFLYQTLYLSLRGVVIANVLVFLIALLQKKYFIFSLNPEVYYMDHVPFSFDFYSIIFINIATIFISYLTLIIPSIIITNMKPIKSIRFE